MTIDVQNILESILESLNRIDYIRPEDVPGIDLYMVLFHRPVSADFPVLGSWHGDWFDRICFWKRTNP